MQSFEINNWGNSSENIEVRYNLNLLRREHYDDNKQFTEKPQWEKIIELGLSSLQECKDLYVLNMVSESLCALYGLPGLENALLLMDSFFNDKKAYFPTHESVREKYFYWINYKLPKYLYYNNEIEKIFSTKEVTKQQIQTFSEKIESIINLSKKFYFINALFEKCLQSIFSRICVFDKSIKDEKIKQ